MKKSKVETRTPAIPKKLGKVKKAVPRMEPLAPEANPDLMVLATDFQELQSKYDDLKGKAIDLELLLREKDIALAKQALELKSLREAEPPKIDRKRIQNALDTVLYSLLMDAKGALMASGDPSAAEVAIRITQVEMNMPALTLTETMLVQRAKAMAKKWIGGLEVDKSEIDGFFKLVEKLS